MDFKAFREKISQLGVCEERSFSDNYIEVVFFTIDTDKWNNLLSEALGQALKPAGAAPTAEAQALTKDCGGIFANQTLFKKDFAQVSVMAMLWPWQDGEHTTLKMALAKKKDG